MALKRFENKGASYPYLTSFRFSSAIRCKSRFFARRTGTGLISITKIGLNRSSPIARLIFAKRFGRRRHDSGFVNDLRLWLNIALSCNGGRHPYAAEGSIRQCNAKQHANQPHINLHHPAASLKSQTNCVSLLQWPQALIAAGEKSLKTPRAIGIINQSIIDRRYQSIIDRRYQSTIDRRPEPSAEDLEMPDIAANTSNFSDAIVDRMWQQVFSSFNNRDQEQWPGRQKSARPFIAQSDPAFGYSFAQHSEKLSLPAPSKKQDTAKGFTPVKRPSSAGSNSRFPVRTASSLQQIIFRVNQKPAMAVSLAQNASTTIIPAKGMISIKGGRSFGAAISYDAFLANSRLQKEIGSPNIFSSIENQPFKPIFRNAQAGDLPAREATYSSPQEIVEGRRREPQIRESIPFSPTAQDLERISHQVCGIIERKLLTEKERRGIHG